MRAATAAVTASLALAGLSACGGDSEPAGNARKGGSITVGASSLPRVLDPSLATDARALQALRAVYTSPLVYRHAEGRDGTELTPGLARDLPEVSEDGLTYVFRFHAGLSYSDGTRVRASDFERAVNRARGLDSPYAVLYDGVEAIEADDRTGRVTLVLEEPDSTFPYVLALPVSAPVPAGTREADLSSSPPPGIGPYTLASVRPGERWVLRRARAFDLPDLPTGNVDEVTIGRSGSPADQADRVAIGTTLDVMQELPPTSQLPEIRSEYADRYEEHPTASALFFTIDPAVPPFDDRRVRQAVGVAVDGPTLERLYSGRLEPSCNVLPSSVPGHSGLDPCPVGDRDEPPDLVRARELVEDAGQVGTVVTVASSRGVAPSAAVRYFVTTLRKIGLAARAQPTRGAASLTLELIAPPIAHPAAFLAGFGERTRDLELDADIDRLLTEPDASSDDWGEIDRRLVEEAYVAPLGSQRLPTFLSERIDVQGCATFHPIFGVELASLCLR